MTEVRWEVNNNIDFSGWGVDASLPETEVLYLFQVVLFHIKRRAVNTIYRRLHSPYRMICYRVEMMLIDTGKNNIFFAPPPPPIPPFPYSMGIKRGALSANFVLETLSLKSLTWLSFVPFSVVTTKSTWALLMGFCRIA